MRCKNDSTRASKPLASIENAADSSALAGPFGIARREQMRDLARLIAASRARRGGATVQQCDVTLRALAFERMAQKFAKELMDGIGVLRTARDEQAAPCEFGQQAGRIVRLRYRETRFAFEFVEDRGFQEQRAFARVEPGEYFRGKIIEEEMARFLITRTERRRIVLAAVRGRGRPRREPGPRASLRPAARAARARPGRHRGSSRD